MTQKVPSSSASSKIIRSKTLYYTNTSENQASRGKSYLYMVIALNAQTVAFVVVFTLHKVDRQNTPINRLRTQSTTELGVFKTIDISAFNSVPRDIKRWFSQCALGNPGDP